MKRKNIYIWIWLVCCFVLLCRGCAEHNNKNATGVQDVVSSSTEVLTESEETNDDYIIDSADILSIIPEFSEDTYIVINNNIPYFTSEEKECKNAFEIIRKSNNTKSLIKLFVLLKSPISSYVFSCPSGQ